MIVKVLMLVLLVLLLIDGALTLLILRKGGSEQNQLLNKLDAWLHQQGWGARWGWLVVSRGVGAFGVIVLGASHAALGDWSPAALGFLIALFGAVQVSNWRVWRGGQPLVRL